MLLSEVRHFMLCVPPPVGAHLQARCTSCNLVAKHKCSWSLDAFLYVEAAVI
jgi:hypothetical protein